MSEQSSVALMGVLLGGLLAFGSALLHRWWQVRDREHTAKQVRAAEVRLRMDEKADEILRLLRDLEQSLFGRSVISEDFWPDGHEERRNARRLLNEVLQAGGYLTQPLRQHLQVLGHLLPDAERLWHERWVNAAPRTVAFSSLRNAKEQVERYLRAESVGTELPEPLQSYEAAWQDLQNMIEHQWEQDVAEAERRSAGESEGDSADESTA